MEFEWDEAKNRQNRAKHGISFEEAASVFDGDYISILDESSLDEVREKTFGLVRAVLVACVVHTDRGGVIRIISARRATPSERRMYDAHIR